MKFMIWINFDAIKQFQVGLLSSDTESSFGKLLYDRQSV